MKKRILALGMVLALVAVLVVPMSIAWAEDTGAVNCTVSGKLVAVTVADGSVAYGTLALGGTQNTADAGLNDHQTATNTGTVAEKFQIKSSNAIGGTAWTLGAAAGANTFTHTASVAAPATPSWTIAMTVADTYVDLVASVAAGGTQAFDLKIDMPTSVTTYTEHTITVTVLATEA